MSNSFESFIKHLRFESIALAILMVVLTNVSTAPLWILPATFLIFDIGMVGYLKNPQLGARIYNVSHDYTVPTLCIAAGLFFSVETISIIGYCWTFHIAVDRSLGYGLKHRHAFHETHLGSIKK